MGLESLDRRLARLEERIKTPGRRFEELEGKQPCEMTEEELVAVMLGHWPTKSELEKVLGRYRSMTVEELVARARELRDILCTGG